MASLVQGWMRTQQRESLTFDDLFLTEYARVVAIARRVLGDGHEAEDVAQEVFCAFYRQHRPDAPYAAPWLHRAAAHTALNVIRGKRRRFQRETRTALATERLDLSAQDALDPQEALAAAERRREVRAALARVPEKSAAVLVLRYSGLSYAEVADALGVSIGQIGTLLRRAEAALRKEMTDGTSL
jgi:RNA polymerase sigma factor (sigma-70 family)